MLIFTIPQTSLLKTTTRRKQETAPETDLGIDRGKDCQMASFRK